MEDRYIDPGRDVFVVIPGYNEASVIAGVVRDVVALGVSVVVVDDASSDDTAGQAARAGAITIRHALNRGQGASLQTGLELSLRQGARAIVTFDADGQHRSKDILALLEPILIGEYDVTLGSRFLGSADDIPATRQILLKAGVAFTRIFSRAEVTDVHNGLRAFSRRAAQTIRIRQDRMAHASEILDQVVDSGLPYVEVPVHVRYTEYSRAKGQRTSSVLRVVLDYFLGGVAR